MGMSRHMKVCRFLEEETEKLEEALANKESEDWNRLDILYQTRQELQELKEENVLYKQKFVTFGKNLFSNGE